MSANDHEDADSKPCLHVDDALNEEATNVLVKIIDTDVVVILVGIFHDLAQHHPEMQLWVGFCSSPTATSTQSAKNLGRKKLGLCSFFTPSRVLMQHASSAVRVRRQHRKHGTYIWQPLLGSPAHLKMDLFLRIYICSIQTD